MPAPVCIEYDGYTILFGSANSHGTPSQKFDALMAEYTVCLNPVQSGWLLPLTTIIEQGKNYINQFGIDDENDVIIIK